MGMQWDVLNIKRDGIKYRDILINRGVTYMIISMISNTCIHQDRIRDGQLKITLGQPMGHIHIQIYVYQVVPGTGRGGSFEWNNYRKKMAYRNVFEMQNQRSVVTSTNEQMVVEMPMGWHERIHAPLTKWIHERANQWIIESMNQWITESMNQRSNESLNQWTNESVKQRDTESIKQWVNESVNQSLNQWISDSKTIESMSQWIS